MLRLDERDSASSTQVIRRSSELYISSLAVKEATLLPALFKA